MSNQTLPSPAKRRATSSTTAASASGKSSTKNQTGQTKPANKPSVKLGGSAAKYRMRQTGRVEGLRDGKPLIFGWGRHLTRAQKLRYQRIALVSFAALIIVAVIGTVGFGILNETYLIPHSTIVSVNGVNISQDDYRKNLAVEAQQLWNTMQQEIEADQKLQAKIQANDATAINDDAIYQSQIQSNEGKYSEATVTATAATDMVNDQLIRIGAKQFEKQNHLSVWVFDPTPKSINDALTAFKKSFPVNETYASFLKSNSMTDADVKITLAMQIRAKKMNDYLATQYKSPTRVLHLREVQTDTQAHGVAARAALVKGKLSDATWKTVANADSVDPNTKAIGGDLGWVTPGSGDAAVELWAYASNRKVGDLSPVLATSSGAYAVVQVVGVNPSYTVDAATLASNKSNALPHWLAMETAQLGKKVGTPDTTMLTATRNLPKAPNLNGALPTFTAPASSNSLGSSLGG